jgi:futalosine hydrolase
MFAVVVPTEIEAAKLVDSPCEFSFGEPQRVNIGDIEVQLAVCGFGMAAAGVGVCRMLHVLASPIQGVILAGTAGILDRERADIGSVVVGQNVRCVDLGLPDGDDRLTVSVPQLSDWDEDLDLSIPAALADLPSGEILSVAGPARSVESAKLRRALYPNGLVEEMEGYSVAIACHTWNVPLTIVRGISNQAGDREKSNWRFADALNAVKQTIQIAVTG